MAFKQTPDLTASTRPQWRPSTQIVMHLLAVSASADALAWGLSPSFVQSSAYEFVRRLATQRAWAAVMAVAAAGFVVALLDVGPTANSAKVRHAAATAGFSVYGLVCATVGLSIFVLSFDGAVSAITGAGKWWLIFALCTWQLSRSYYRARVDLFVDEDGRTVRSASTGDVLAVLAPTGVLVTGSPRGESEG